MTLVDLDALIDDVVAIPDERDGFEPLASAPLDFSMSSAQTVRTMQGFSAHDISGRRRLLAGLSVLIGTSLLRPVREWAAVVPLRRSTAGVLNLDDVAEREQAVSVFCRWDASGTGGLCRKTVVGQLNAVAESLDEHHPPTERHRLFQITAELAQLAGWMSYDQGLPVWHSATTCWPCTRAGRPRRPPSAPRSSGRVAGGNLTLRPPQNRA